MYAEFRTVYVFYMLMIYYGIVLVPKETEASLSAKEEICEENTNMTNEQSQQLINSMYPEVRKY